MTNVTNERVRPLDLDDAFVCVMTGAGVSAESGIPTFRDANGLWENHRVEDVASPEGFARDPKLVWRFYSIRREKAADCAPNAGHRALAALEKKLGDRFLLVTQNVDGLHRRAGSETAFGAQRRTTGSAKVAKQSFAKTHMARVVELHGNLFTSRCSSCARPPFADEASYVDGALPTCDRCGALVRPHIVWFGEALDPRDLDRFDAFLREAARAKRRLIYVAAGTSGVVYPAAGLVHAAKHVGAHTVLVNLDAPANVDAFDRVERGKSGEILPKLFAV